MNKLARRMLERGPKDWQQEFSDWDFPPKPPGIHWSTYNRAYEEWEYQEDRQYG